MHPCPQCGAPLRWIPEAGFWNCDQCGNRITPNAAPATPPPHQQGYPPQQQGYPPQGYQPQQGYGHYPQPGAPGKSKGKLVAIIAGVGALAAGGIVLAVVLSKKGSGDGGGGGFDNGEALAKATLEALAAGDGDKLVSFMPTMEMAAEATECPAEVKEKNAEDTKKGFEEMKKRFAEAASKMKGSGATFKSFHTEGIAKQETPAGGQLGDCKAKVAITFTGVGVEHDFVNPADKSKQDHKTTYGVMIIEGKYYLVDVGQIPPPLSGEAGETPTTPPPDTPPPDTPTAPVDVNTAIAEFEKIKSAACSCTDKACADAETSNLMAAAQKYTDVATKDPVAKDKLTAIANDVGACVKKFEGTTAPPDTPTTPPEPGQGLPECEAYAKAAERFIKCSKVPKQSQDAVRTAVDTMRKNWGDPSKMSDDQKKSAAETCTTLEKSMKDAAAAMGCK